MESTYRTETSASSLSNKVDDLVSEARDRAYSMADQYADMSATADRQEHREGLVARAIEPQTVSLQDHAFRFVRENPGFALLGAFALGFILNSVLPGKPIPPDDD